VIRFQKGARPHHLFGNGGKPTSGDINMATRSALFSGTPETTAACGGGRGDGVGWRSNYKDAYVNVCVGDQLSTNTSRVPGYHGYNADGSVRYHRPAYDVEAQIMGPR
jgi:hypothetical protein